MAVNRKIDVWRNENIIYIYIYNREREREREREKGRLREMIFSSRLGWYIHKVIISHYFQDLIW